MKYARTLLENSCKITNLDADGTDRIYVRFSNRHQWIDYWSSHFIPVERLTKDAYVDCGRMTFSNMNDHLRCSCMNRVVPVATTNDKKIAIKAIENKSGDVEEEGGVERDIEHTADFDKISAGQAVDFRNAHKLAVKRLVSESVMSSLSKDIGCPNCGFIVDRVLLEAHQNNDCKKLYKRCRIGCGQKILVPDMLMHITEQCPKRELICADCKEPVWAEDFEDHRQSVCVQRPKNCSNSCGTPGLTYRNEEEHLIFSCPNRQIVCSCGVRMSFCDQYDHIIADCPKKLGKGCNSSILG